MTRVTNMLMLFRTRRTRELMRNSDAVSFDSFTNDYGDNNRTQESSLSSQSESRSPAKGNKYKRMSEKPTERSSIPSSTILAIFIAIALIIVIVLPLFYLLHCFDVIDLKHQRIHILPSSIDKEHYQPSSKVHDILNDYSTLPTKDKRKAGQLPPPPKPDSSQCQILTNDERFDCFPETNANIDGCAARGCCWAVPKEDETTVKNGNINVPYCFYPTNYASYTYVNITDTAYGLVAFLKRQFKSAYPDDVEIIKMTVKYETNDRLHVKFTDPLRNRFESPFPEVPVADKASTNLSYKILIDPLKTGFKITRKSDNTTIFDTTNIPNMIFANQFLQLSTKLPSQFIYGIGEHRSSFLLPTQWQMFTLFNHDNIPMENTNLYGSHPFYLLIEPSGSSHGVLLLNSNAMDIILQPTPAVTFRPVGGVLDFYFFLGPTPSDVISQYTDLVGRPFMPPYWSLGFHLCRFGYKTLNETKTVMQRNLDAGIPIDTQWNDLDYMNNSNDFTYDEINFNGLPEFVKELHSRGMHYIPLVDPGVSASEIPGMYPPYDLGIKMDIFVKNISGQPFVGKVWNRASTVWPDFTHPNTVDYWTLMLKSLHSKIEFDGTWIDMNEPSNFLSGSFNGCPQSRLEKPPYMPYVAGGVMNYKTMCMSARHYAGLHYDVHNLYGISEAIVTNFALAEIRGKRPMIISRSTFPGFGHFAGHWSGDVYSKWEDMKFTIPQLLSFSLFGVPLMGADICGFNGNTTASLCNRWMQLGAFYPFSRNHNTDDGIDQDPVAMGEQVIASSKKALTVRYSLLPYLYTLFWQAHVNGTTVSRPLFFEFAQDKKTYGIDDQFLWGPAVMIVPVLSENQQFVNPYLPKGLWYDYYTKSVIQSGGQNYNLSAPLDTIPVLIRGGYILPLQSPLNTTTESRKSKIQLLIATNEPGQASGDLYWDDGDSLNTYEEKRYCHLSFWLDSGILRSELAYWNTADPPPHLGSVTVLGVKIPISEVTVNQVSQAFRYDTVNKYLLIENLDVDLAKPFVISWK